MKAQIIEKEGRFYKECGLVILETEKGSSLYIDHFSKKLLKTVIGETFTGKTQHLYITSDDEIKKGDWFIWLKYNLVEKAIKKDNNKDCRKIIATTDTSLGLPQPSDKFIQAYIEAHNRGEKIEKVLVEFEKGNFRPDGSQGYFEPGAFTFEWQPKLKDNNIIIKKVKDSWNIAEIEEIHVAVMKQGCLHEGGSWSDEHERLVRLEFQKWKQQNL